LANINIGVDFLKEAERSEYCEIAIQQEFPQSLRWAANHLS